MNPCIVLFREDLRLSDHPALSAACDTGQPLLCVYLHDEQTPSARAWWLHHSLAALQRSLQQRGSQLCILRGDALQQVHALVQASGADTVYWSRRYAPAQIAADAELKTQLRAQGVQAQSFNARLLHEPWTLYNQSGAPFRVFTPYWKAALRQDAPRAVLPCPDVIPSAPLPSHSNSGENDAQSENENKGFRSLSLEELNLLPSQPNWAANFVGVPGEEGAQECLQRFINGAISRYAAQRDQPSAAATSCLSAHLQCGDISPHQIWYALQGADVSAKDREKFLSEVGWREFSYYLLYHFPQLLTEELNAKFRDFPWGGEDATNRPLIQAWQRGQTGYPMVDAAMRELWQTGIMHNRSRMIAASFLVKHLLIDWREGMRWFWETLLDADIAANTASWQWVAGCGADAAPYFRIFNPIIQAQKFDTEGDYIRRFVPELRRLPAQYLASPWSAPEATLRMAQVELGSTYPRPIVEHSAARARALDALKSLS